MDPFIAYNATMRAARVKYKLLRAVDSGVQCHFGPYLEHADVDSLTITLKQYLDELVEEFFFCNAHLARVAGGPCALAVAHDCRRVELPPEDRIDGDLVCSINQFDRCCFRKINVSALKSVTTSLQLCQAANGCPEIISRRSLLTATVNRYSELKNTELLPGDVRAMSRRAWRLNGGLALPSTPAGRALSASLRCSDARGCAEDVESSCLKHANCGPGLVTYGDKLHFTSDSTRNVTGTGYWLRQLGLKYCGRQLSRQFERCNGLHNGHPICDSVVPSHLSAKRVDWKVPASFVGVPPVYKYGAVFRGSWEHYSAGSVCIAATKSSVLLKQRSGLCTVDTTSADRIPKYWSREEYGTGEHGQFYIGVACVPDASRFYFLDSSSDKLYVNTVSEAGELLNFKEFGVAGQVNFGSIIPLDRGFLFVAGGYVHAFCNNEVTNLKIEAKKILVDQSELLTSH